MLTTSFVHSQAYKEVFEDQHPILIITTSNIASILRQSSINSSNIDAWLSEFNDSRFQDV